jgi:DNA-binding beta-propeller fold protein YncE
MKHMPLTGIVLGLVSAGALMCSSGQGTGVRFHPRVALAPANAKVFAGDSLQFSTTVAGELSPPSIRWSVVGPGAINQNGLYRAADVAATAEVVASTGNGVAQSVAVRTVPPPQPRVPLILSTCYSDGTVNAYDARDFSLAGSLSVGGRAAGITVMQAQRRAVFAVESQIVAIDLRTMHWQASPPEPGVRLSEIAQLAWGYVAATDNDAAAGHPGVRIYRIDAEGSPVFVSAAAAGDTPEGIAAAPDGKTFYVSNINGNSIMRLAIDRFGRARVLAVAKTATRPFGLALDPQHRLLFVADNDTSVVSGARAHPGLERFDSTTLRRVGGIVSTGSVSSLPLGVAVDASLRRLFVTNEGASNVVVFSLPGLRRIAALPTGLTPWLPAVDPVTHRLYVPNARADTISVFSTRTLKQIGGPIATCSYPTSVAVAAAWAR